ncbi:MAG TPA: ATP-binding cassette domain-containing protein [Planctomycetota bacterium]|nr:ATP-binding cassette domain-containing protein [Planctomycetota bacterium]
MPATIEPPSDQIEPRPACDLVLRGVAKRFGANTVLRGVDLVARSGQVTALLGPNGAGKTTLFHVVMGLLRADAGSVTLAAEDLMSLAVHARRARGISFLPQRSASFSELSVQDNVRAVVELIGIPRRAWSREIARLLEVVGLAGLRGRLARDLSGGELRRLEIAKALAGEPRVLLLDEPFAGLDPVVVDRLAELLRGTARAGLTVMISDHQAHQLLRCSDHVVLLSDGVVARSGAPAQLRDDEWVRSVYLGSLP